MPGFAVLAALLSRCIHIVYRHELFWRDNLDSFVEEVATISRHYPTKTSRERAVVLQAILEVSVWIADSLVHYLLVHCRYAQEVTQAPYLIDRIGLGVGLREKVFHVGDGYR